MRGCSQQYSAVLPVLQVHACHLLIPDRLHVGCPPLMMPSLLLPSLVLLLLALLQRLHQCWCCPV